MKRRILVVALSLALLSSLFVFATPAIAKNDTNDKFFEVSFSITRTDFPRPQPYQTYGPPTTLTLPVGGPEGPTDTRTVPYQIFRRNIFLSDRVLDGNFGPEIGPMTSVADPPDWNGEMMNMTINLQSLKGGFSSHYEFDFGDGDTAIFKIQANRSMPYWKYADPAKTAICWYNDVHITFIGGTGVFENFHFSGTGGGWQAAGVMEFTGMAHMAP